MPFRFLRPVFWRFLCCTPAFSSCLMLISLQYKLSNDCNQSISVFTRMQQVAVWVAAGQGESAGMLFLGTYCCQQRFSLGAVWTKKEAGHNKLKSKLYFHKLLSVGHREFHAKYLLLTGHCAWQHLLLLLLVSYLNLWMQSLWDPWGPFNPFYRRSPLNYKYVCPYSSNVELHVFTAFDVILTPTDLGGYILFKTQNWAIWDSQVTEVTIFWTD